jgi:hypothetical protein
MFAFEIPNLRFSMPAVRDIPRHRFVCLNNDGATINDEKFAVGVSMNEAKAGQVLEIADGLVIVEASEAIEAGYLVGFDATGRAVPTSDPAIATAVAITPASAAGELITVKI